MTGEGQSGGSRTLKIDPIEELLKANVIVGTMTPYQADLWFIAEARREAPRV